MRSVDVIVLEDGLEVRVLHSSPTNVPTTYQATLSLPLGSPRADVIAAVEADLLAAGRTNYQAPAGLGLYATSTMVHDEIAIASTPDWQILGRIVTSPGFFSDNDPMMLAHAVGLINTVGLGAELRLVEDAGHMVGGARVYDGTDDIVLVTIGLVDTAGAWQEVALTSDPETHKLRNVNRNEYRLEGRRGDGTTDATSASIRSTTGALLS